ncbi:hypothetical protein COCVIDRAFT_38992 [Bipolaris victoriae FI3]|uniref:Uncharacterized protein n=1 Tax=Bipolaris victoriae (strain FI3) TaxID=930091 RepID=W7EMR9_BIPV3|nr:hypothetical protein COCVIDRAFT_38992 [Bipolaris victoriae FI3]
MPPAPLDACKHTPYNESSVHVTYIVLHIYPISLVPAEPSPKFLLRITITLSLPTHENPHPLTPNCATRFTPHRSRDPHTKKMLHLLRPQSYAFLPRLHHHRHRHQSTPTPPITPPPQMSLLAKTLTYVLACITLSSLLIALSSLSSFYTTLFTCTAPQQLHMLFHASVVGATVLMATLVADDVAAKLLGLHGVRYRSGAAADAVLMCLFWVNVGVGGGAWGLLVVKGWAERGILNSIIGV